MFKSYFKKTTTTNGENIKQDKAFDKLDEAFDKLGDAFNLLGDSFNETECSDGSSSFQRTGDVTITNNNGHIVIEGKIKSLKVNGEDYIN